jgi:hypothetical protein
MITAIVKIPIPESLTPAQYLENVNKIADRFRTIPGLVRKNFLYSGEEGVAGGVYLWESRQAADACYAEGGPWREAITSTFGVQPQISFYETPVVVDNKAGEVLTVA